MPRKSKNVRRGNNEGTLYQRRDNIWVAQVTVGYDSKTGKIKRKSIYGKTRTEVAMKMSALVTDVNKLGYQSSTSDNFETIMRHWLRIYKKSEVTSRTYENKISNCRLHIFPAIGDLKLNEITPDILQTLFVNLLDKKQLCLDTVKKCRYLLRQFFEYGVENKYITYNPISKTKIKARDKDKAKADDYKAIRPEYRTAFMNAVDKHPLWKPLCLASMFGSMRIGEMLALRWRDINLEYGFLAIKHATTQVVEFDDYDNVVSRTTIVSDTKSAASEREIPMPNKLHEAFIALHARRKLEEALLGKSLTAPDDFVFGTENGKLRTYHGTRTMFSRFLEKHQLHDKGIKFHALRHTFSNMLFEMGENPKVVQGLMGHKDVKTTMLYNSIDKKKQYSSAVSILDRAASSMEM